MTSIEWLISKLGISEITHKKLFEQAKEMHKQEIIKVNRDGVDMAVDKKPFIMGEQYYQETFVSKRSDECQFEPTTNTSSATICKHCGKEKFLHKT
jgi:hypothetical protein